MSLPLTRVGFSLTLASLLLASAAGFAATPVERDGVWAQTYSDIAADPNVRFGQLPNGMRYAIMHNATPVGQVSIRLRVGTGSINETDAQQGLAHFLEHMAFKGSKKVAPGETIKMLERLGLAFGADTNAYTSQEETVYMFDLPKADDETIDTGLLLTRETVSELTLDPTEMDHERGVVLSEERLRDTPGYRANIAQLKFLLPDQIASSRMPIGKVDIIKNAPVSDIAAYYHAQYRPERTTLVVVGDIDPTAIQAKIKTAFTGWTNPTPAPAPVDYGKPAVKGTTAKVVVEPGTSLEVDLDWMNPYDNAADVSAMRKRDTIRAIGLSILNRRLNHLAQQPNPPYQRAGASRGNAYHSTDIAELAIAATPETWEKALEAAETLRRQAVQFGVRQDEVDMTVAEGRTARQAGVAGASTRRSPQLAGGLISAAGNDNVFTDPAQNLALFDESVKGLTAAEVSAALKDVFQGAGPLVFVATPKPIEGGEASVLAALQRADTVEVAVAVADADKTWPYTDFGSPGREVDRKVVDDLGATFIRFANGVRLTVKPTTFSRDQIMVNVRVGDGLRSLPRDKLTSLWASSSMISGGLKDLTSDDIRQIYTGKVASVNFDASEDAFELRGATRAADLDSQMQLLAAYMTAPAYRPEAFERVRTAMETRLDQVSATPGGVLGHNLLQLDHDGDMRWRSPDKSELSAAKPGDLRELLEGPLTKGEIEVVMVGDVTVDQAESAVAKTFGAMAPRPKATTSGQNLAVRFPGPATPAPLSHTGRADQAVAVLAWPTDDFFSDPQRARVTRLVEQIFRIRLTEQFRIAEGNTYSPGTDFEASETFPHYGYVMARVETPPDKVPHFYDEAMKIAADMRTKGVTADELERARKPRIEALEHAQETNGYWMAVLAGAQTDKRKLDAIRETITGLQKVTVADVKKAAQLYLTDNKAWKLSVLPQKPSL